MGIFQTAFAFIKAMMFFVNLWSEKNQQKAAEKAALADRITNAFKQTDKAKRASRLNSAVADINKLR